MTRDRTHYIGCWEDHLECAVIKIRKALATRDFSIFCLCDVEGNCPIHTPATPPATSPTAQTNPPSPATSPDRNHDP